MFQADGLNILDNKLISYSSTGGNVTIPEFVTEILPTVFKDCKTLTDVTFPNSVKSILALMFSGCEALKSVNLPSGVIEIQPSSFENCKSLISIDIPNSVPQIYEDTFNGCTSLRHITIPNSVTRIGHRAFEACVSLIYNEYDNALYLGNEITPFYALIKPKAPSIASCVIHADTKVIAEKAFADCKLLTNIIISDGVTNISDYAFAGCLNLRQITIPNSVTSIGKHALDLCVDLAFECNEYDNALYLGNGDNPYHTLWEATDDDITSCEIHNDTKVIYEGAFSDCSLLREISIPNTVVFIGENAFSNSTKRKWQFKIRIRIFLKYNIFLRAGRGKRSALLFVYVDDIITDVCVVFSRFALLSFRTICNVPCHRTPKSERKCIHKRVILFKGTFTYSVFKNINTPIDHIKRRIFK